jgi:hypothetical protein
MVSKNIRIERMPACNSTYPKGGVSCSKESFVVNETLVFQIKFCGKSPALRVAAKRYSQCYETFIASILIFPKLPLGKAEDE